MRLHVSATARTNALLSAVAGRQVAEARMLLEQGADANAITEDGKPVLLAAAEGDYANELVPLLLNKGAEVNAVNKQGQTALMLAAGNYHVDAVKLLVARGAKINAADNEGNTALLLVMGSRLGYLEAHKPLVPFLLEHEAQVNVRNQKGITPLMRAAEEGHPALRLLLNKDAEVDARDEAGETAFFYAFHEHLLTLERYNSAYGTAGKGFGR